MPQAIKIGNSVYQVEDNALAIAVDQQLTKNDSLTLEVTELKRKLDAAEVKQEAFSSELSEAKASLNKADEDKTRADAELAALQTKLDAAIAKTKELEAEKAKKAEEDEENLEKKSKPKMDSDEVKAYCAEFLAVVNEVSPTLKKNDSSFEPDFGLSPLEYKARYLKTIETLPAEAKARIDSEGSDRDAFVEHLYLALKPQPASAKNDEASDILIEAIDKNRILTTDSGEQRSRQTRTDSPTMKARKERQFPNTYNNK